LFLYDVTSSYLEGEHSALGEFGYNRDGKKGKLQIVIGLLADPSGEPLAVRVFSGNTADPESGSRIFSVPSVRDWQGLSSSSGAAFPSFRYTSWYGVVQASTYRKGSTFTVRLLHTKTA